MLKHFGHLMQRANSLEKTLMLGKTEGKRRRRWQNEMLGWHHWLNGHEFEQAPGVGDTGKPGKLQSMGLQRVRHNWVTELNWYSGGDEWILETRSGRQSAWNYGWKLVTLHSGWWPKPIPRRRNSRSLSSSLRRPYKKLRKEEELKAKDKGKDIPNWMQSSRE